MADAPLSTHPAERLHPNAKPGRTLPLEPLEATVAAAFTISRRALRARTRRSARTALARQTAMYLAHVVFGLSLTEVGQAFDRDRTTAAHACRTMEALRDDPHLDRLLMRLERACIAAQQQAHEGRCANV